MLGIDQGPIVIMAENHRTGNVWKTVMKNSIITNGLQKAGFTSTTAVDDAGISLPENFALEQNYPNPFNPVTTIRYAVPVTEYAAANVKLQVYDMLGTEVAALVNEKKSAGTYSIQFSAERLSSGVYFYRLSAGNYSSSKKMIILR